MEKKQDLGISKVLFLNSHILSSSYKKQGNSAPLGAFLIVTFLKIQTYYF